MSLSQARTWIYNAICRGLFCCSVDWYKRWLFILLIFIQNSASSVFDIYFTEPGAVFTTVLPVLFKYCYKYCYYYKWQPKTLSHIESRRFGTLKYDSTHHFFRNACTKSGSLRFSQFSGCWLILSVYIIMSFDFPFVRFLGVR